MLPFLLSRRIADRKVLRSRRRAETKLARFLLLARGQLQNRRPVIDLPTTRLDIADYLAMAIKTVPRIITELAGCGVVAKAGRSIAVLKSARSPRSPTASFTVRLSGSAQSSSERNDCSFM